MSKSSGTVKVRFANNATLDGVQYKQGEVYEVAPADARHLVHVGKVQVVHQNTKTTDKPAPAGDEK